ncbi:MAG TPA: hypothetical protein VF755_22915, partial [Catenuloplanes sp.]
PRAAKASPHAIIIVLTNPVDAITYLCITLSGFPASRVLGTGTLIDTGRSRSRRWLPVTNHSAVQPTWRLRKRVE